MTTRTESNRDEPVQQQATAAASSVSHRASDGFLGADLRALRACLSSRGLQKILLAGISFPSRNHMSVLWMWTKDEAKAQPALVSIVGDSNEILISKAFDAARRSSLGLTMRMFSNANTYKTGKASDDVQKPGISSTISNSGRRESLLDRSSGVYNFWYLSP